MLAASHCELVAGSGHVTLDGKDLGQIVFRLVPEIVGLCSGGLDARPQIQSVLVVLAGLRDSRKAGIRVG